jgi:hypothetical protein
LKASVHLAAIIPFEDLFYQEEHSFPSKWGARSRAARRRDGVRDEDEDGFLYPTFIHVVYIEILKRRK